MKKAVTTVEAFARAPLRELREALMNVSGVEEVRDATVDTQLGAIWGVPVVLRLLQ